MLIYSIRKEISLVIENNKTLGHPLYIENRNCNYLCILNKPYPSYLITQRSHHDQNILRHNLDVKYFTTENFALIINLSQKDQSWRFFMQSIRRIKISLRKQSIGENGENIPNIKKQNLIYRTSYIYDMNYS